MFWLRHQDPTLATCQPLAATQHQALLHFVKQARYSYEHLDWHGVQGWLNAQPFWVTLDKHGQIRAALAAPPDLPTVTWWRVAAAGTTAQCQKDLPVLWQAVQADLKQRGVRRVAVLDLEDWLPSLLATLGFANSHQVVTLRRLGTLPVVVAPSVSVTLQALDDSLIEPVAALDQAAFAPPWQHSALVLRRANEQSQYARVAMHAGQVVGYQITMLGGGNAHITRLAVAPAWQGHGIGRTLVVDVLRHCQTIGRYRVGVNTQSDNASSLALYQQLGFVKTGETIGVWQLQL